jgi:hypothetical protein
MEEHIIIDRLALIGQIYTKVNSATDLKSPRSSSTTRVKTANLKSADLEKKTNSLRVNPRIFHERTYQHIIAESSKERSQK